MTLQEYINNLQAFLDEHPQAATAKVVYEVLHHYGYNEVEHAPQLGHYNESGEFQEPYQIQNSGELAKTYPLNAVCIN